MANQALFTIDGITAMIGTLEQIEQEVERRIDNALTKLAQKIIYDAKKLAPLDTGDLEAALVISDVKTLLKIKYIDFGVSPEVDHYATVQHEGFRRTRNGRVIYMSPGPKTASKPPHKGYIPGKKYLENAITINEPLILEELRNALSFG